MEKKKTLLFASLMSIETIDDNKISSGFQFSYATVKVRTSATCRIQP
jgi:hypothetical protein